MTLFLAGLALVIAGGIATALVTRINEARGAGLYQMFVVAGCVLAALDPARTLATGVPVAAALHAGTPGGDWVIGTDTLSSVFLLAVLGVGAMCAVFGTRDLRTERASGHAAPIGFAQLSFAVLLSAVALVVAARTVIVFLGAWEVMAISSYLLIVRHHEDADVRRSGLVYLVATHTATLSLFAMFASWPVRGGDWSFAALAAAAPSLTSGTTTAILLLALVGFGFKAGFVPLHFWLPPAHAAAPSHVSALMSGIVIKTGIYGLLRVLLLLGGAPAWWGWVVLTLGAVSGVLGVLWALAQHDIKRLLAYHSVENIGIILMGIGVGVLGVAHRAPVVAMLGFAGALLHTVNHALFKSLLFLSAGAVYRITGTRNMEELGGLARRMPLTWLAFVIGAAAIIGVPPFNGFVSEWLVYNGLFLTAQAQGGERLRLALLGLPSLALIGALALACFAKVSGVVFLGAARTERAAHARDGSLGTLAPMLLLATACVALGVLPMLGIALVQSPARELAGSTATQLPDSVIAGAWAIMFVALAVGVISIVLWLLRYLATRRIPVRRAATWACGYSRVTPRMQYTASSFAAPVLSLFGRLSGVYVERTATSFRTHPIDLVLDGVALPLWSVLQRGALRLRGIQQGRLHVYLLYVLAALLVLLAYLSFAPRP